MAGAAIFVSSHGQQKRAMRHFGVQPGQTLSLSVAQIIDGDHTDLPDVVTGIVILRFFAPLDVGANSFFSQMVSAEQHIGAGPDGPGHILPLRVDTPQQLILRRERR